MKIAIDISPLSSGHKVRGVGSYVSMIKNNIERYDKKNKYIFFEGKVPGEIDIVHYPYFDPFFSMLPFRNRVKTVVTVHDLTTIRFKKHFPSGIQGRVKWNYNKMLLRNADLIIADSKSSKKDIVDIVGVGENKVKVVYLAADPKFKKLQTSDFRLQTRKKYSLPEKFLLYVGDATWNKNLPRIIEAVKKADANLVLVGKVWEQDLKRLSANPWNKDLRKVLSEIDSDSRFIKLGFVPTEDVVRLYDMAIALLMPSLYEGFGLPVLEAMSCGCPVITTREGSLPEVGEGAVYYVDARSAGSISEGIKKLFGNKDLREQLSKKGLMQSEKFSVEKSITDLIKAY